MERIITNLGGGKVRRATLEGRPHLVAPMVMITEGVHAGSEGPLFYPLNELRKAEPAWNYRPIVVYHPKQNGVGVSACSPDVLNTRKVGVVLNTRTVANTAPAVGGKQMAEAWIDEAQAGAVDGRVLDALNNGTMMELSTGLFTQNEKAPGTYNGAPYDLVARNHRPDHLALLPDEVGACSIADGAGFLRLNEALSTIGYDQTQRLILAVNESLKVTNAKAVPMSDGNIRSMLYGVLRERLGEEFYLSDVFSEQGFVIYERGGKLWQLNFTEADGAYELDQLPSEVVRVSEYRTPEGKPVGNQTEQKMSRTQQIDTLIKNGGPWGETDREFLTAMPEPQFAKVLNSTPAKPADPPAAPPATPATAPAATTAAAPAPAAPAVVNAAPAPAAPAKPATMQEYVQNAPEELRGPLAQLVANAERQKEQLAQTIVANANCRWTIEQLRTKDVAELENIAAMLGPTANQTTAPTPDYWGQGGGGHVYNQRKAPTDSLPLPTIDFGAAIVQNAGGKA